MESVAVGHLTERCQHTPQAQGKYSIQPHHLTTYGLLFFPQINIEPLQYTQYMYLQHNDVSVNDGSHTRRWSRNIIVLKYNIKIPLCYNCLQHSVQ